MMPAPTSVLGLTIEYALRELEAAVAALAAGDQAAAATAFADLSVHADTARRILDPLAYSESEGETGGADAFKPFQNRFKNGDVINPYPSGAGKDAETDTQPLAEPFNFLPESRLADVAATRRAALERRHQQTDQAPETATPSPQHPSAADTPAPLLTLQICTTDLDIATIRSIQREMLRRELRGKSLHTSAGDDFGGLPRLSYEPAAPVSRPGTPLYGADAPSPSSTSWPALPLAGRYAARLSQWWEGWLLIHPRAHVLLLRICACLPRSSSCKCRRMEESVTRQEEQVSG